MNAPQNLIIPTLFAGETATIRWDMVANVDGYILERRFNRTFDDPAFTWDDFERRFPTWNAHDAEGLTWDEQEALIPDFTIFTGWQNSFTDKIPKDAVTAMYRVRAFAGTELSPFNTSQVITISTERRPPIISGTDSHIGSKFRAFDIPFVTSDPAEGHDLDVTARLNGSIIQTWDNIAQGVENQVSISESQFNALALNSTNTITITVVGDTGLTTTRTFTFTVVEDTITDAVFFVMRDGIPVARLTTQRTWTDFMAVGTHRYFVRGVDKYDNFVDSNEITVTISLKYATLSLTDNPANYIELIVRRNERPSIERNYSVIATGTRYEGRTYPIYNVSDQREDTLPIAFTMTTQDEYDALHSLIRRGSPLVYRDQYDTHMIGVILAKDDSFQGRFQNQTFNQIVDFSVTINRIDFNEEIPYD